ncbi:Sex peptide receptor, partial [Lamellibrachia satsuma]
LYEFSREYATYHGYIAAIACLWGIVANIANIVVLTRKNMLSSTNMILTWLAVADLLTMTSYFPVSIHFYILKHPQLEFPATFSHSWIQFMLFHINFTVVCHTIAIWLTIMLATFRYLFICYSAHSITMCSMRRTKLAILAVYIITTIMCVPNYLLTSIITRQIVVPLDNANVTDSTAQTYYMFVDSALAATMVNTVNYWIQAFLVKLIPCMLLTVLTILLLLAMHRAKRRRMRLKSQGRKDESERAQEHNRTTRMLLAVVVLFLISELPQGILTLCSIFIVDFFNDVYWPLGDLLDIMALLNNSINFILYCTMSRQFRNTFTHIFCGCCPE